MPYTFGLVLTGVGLTAVRVAGGAAVTPRLILEAFLPPLLFEAALLFGVLIVATDPVSVIAT